MKILSKQLKIVLTVSLLFFIVGCQCLPKTPDIRPKQIVQRLNVCKEYKIDFGEKMTFKYQKDLPLQDCLIDGSFVLTDTELTLIRNYYNEAKKCQNECKGK